MKKSDLFEIYEEFMKKEENRLACRFFGSAYEELHEALFSSYKEVVAALRDSSTPLEFFRRAEFSYDWYVKQLRNAAMDGKPLPCPTDLDQFIDIFASKALGDMQWEDGDYPYDYYRRPIKGVPVAAWDITKAWDLGRNEAQALQYILRAKYKDQEKEDLEKAIRFLRRALEEMEEVNEQH